MKRLWLAVVLLGSVMVTPVAAQNATPSASLTYGSGNGLNFVPETSGQTVEVVMTGPVKSIDDSNALTFVLRNGTERTVKNVQVSVAIRDKNGALVAGGNAGLVAPYVIPAGEIALGYVTIESTAIPEGSTPEFDVRYQDFEEGDSQGVTIIESNVAGGRLVVRGTYDGQFTEYTIHVLYACFDPKNGTIARFHWDHSNGTYPPGSDFSVQFIVGNIPAVCDDYLVAAVPTN